MRTGAKAAIVAGSAVTGYIVGVLAGVVAWSLPRYEHVEGSSGNGRHQYLWPFVGSTIGLIAGAALALVLVNRRRPSGVTDTDVWDQSSV